MFQLDRTLKLLSDSYRRDLMYEMANSEEEVFSYEELTQDLTDESYEEEFGEEVLEVQIVHKHLPQMEEIGFVEHDKRSETVRYIGDEETEELLGTLKQYE